MNLDLCHHKYLPIWGGVLILSAPPHSKFFIRVWRVEKRRRICGKKVISVCVQICWNLDRLSLDNLPRPAYYHAYIMQTILHILTRRYPLYIRIKDFDPSNISRQTDRAYCRMQMTSHPELDFSESQWHSEAVSQWGKGGPIWMLPHLETSNGNLPKWTDDMIGVLEYIGSWLEYIGGFWLE